MRGSRKYLVAAVLVVGAALGAVVLSLGDLRAAPADDGKENAAPAPAKRPAQQTPLLMEVLDPPQPVKGTDGKYHLVYELVLTNSSPGAAKVEWIRTKDADTGKVVGRLVGADVTAATTRLGDITGETAETIKSGEVGLVYLDVTFKKRSDVPDAIKHTVKTTFDLPPGTFTNLFPAETINSGARIRVIQEAATVLGPPLKGKNWVVGNGCCDVSPHRGAMIALNQKLVGTERYAIDYIQSDNKGRLTFPSEENDKNTDFPAYNEPVLAMADGKIVSVVDRYPDVKPGVLDPDLTYKDAIGNHVILDIGDGKSILYAHLKPNSIEVKKGERVRSGQRLARLGNSGNTTAPHLHFQLQDEPIFPTAGLNLPYVIDSFKYQGYIEDDLTPRLLDNPEPRRNELPLSQSVVAYPAP